MDDITVYSRLGTKLSQHVENHRREITSAVLRSPGESTRQNSIAESVFVNTFVDKLCAEFEGAPREQLSTWLAEAQTEKSNFDVRALIGLTCGAVSGSFVAKEGFDGEVVRYLNARGRQLEDTVSGSELRRKRSVLPDPAMLVNKQEVVDSLLAVLETRDEATCEHSRAVGAWCGRIGKAMGMSVEQQEFVALCGTLHDIGKVATPTEILTKAGPLTNDEWAAMRSHSETGARILEDIPSLRDVAPVVRAHHERYDGMGYPDRLAGGAIPLAARIVSVADAFHAMVSKRPYRDAVSIGQAIQNLQDGRNSQWDALAVDAMISIVRPAATRPLLKAVNSNRL